RLIVPVHDQRSDPSQQNSERAAQYRDECRLDDYGLDDRPARDAHQPKSRDVATSLLDLENHDAKQKQRAGDDGDHADRAVEATHHLERPRWLDGDVTGAVRAEPERDVVDLFEEAADIGG